MGPLRALALLALASQAGAQLPGREAPPDGDRLVRVSLVAERAAIAPEERLLLGVRLVIERGWHVYWTNPGDFGFPTTARLEAPPGFELAAARFPGPQRFESPGEITSYGYADELLIVVEVRAPRELAPGSRARFAVEARWLACEEICLSGAGRAELELPVVAEGAAPATEVALFARWLPRMPRAAEELEGLSWAWLEGDEPALELSVRGARELELFPAAHAVLELVEQGTTALADGSRLRARWRLRASKRDGPLVARGLLRVRDGRGERFHELALPVPVNEPTEKEPGGAPPRAGGAPGSGRTDDSPHGGHR